jgi:hypothetical protein
MKGVISSGTVREKGYEQKNTGSIPKPYNTSSGGDLSGMYGIQFGCHSF